MKVKELIKQFSKEDMETEILFSSDEELNMMYSRCRIDQLAPSWHYNGKEIEAIAPARLVLFGLSDSEVE